MAVSHPTPGGSSSCCCFRTQGVLAHADEVVVRARTSCLFICPLKRKCASSLKRRTSKRGGCSRSVCWYSVKFIALVLVGLALSLANLHSVWKQFLVAMKDSRHITPENPHFLWRPSGGLSWWLFQRSPQVLKVCSCSGSQTCTTVGLVADCHTARVSERLYQASDGAAMWGFHPWEFATELPLDKIFWKVQGFWSAVEHKIVPQSPSRCQMELVAALYVSPGNKSKILISL